ncbi:hypothetical protein B0H10DRAFT_2220683 [Mycena sp. CBHHK59/15]|nr:hypothetical protein B0H10DRAFT_2220683 [Mycena sp. CBHHK59/15]
MHPLQMCVAGLAFAAVAAALSNVQAPAAAMSGGAITVTWYSTSSDRYHGPELWMSSPSDLMVSTSAFSHMVFPSISMSATGISMHSAPSSASSARTIHISASAAPSASASASSAAHPASSFLSSAVSGARPASPSTGAAGATRVPAFGLGLGLGAAVALGGLVVGAWAL